MLVYYRLDAIARDAELSEQSEADLKRLGQQLHTKLHEMAASKLSENNQVLVLSFVDFEISTCNNVFYLLMTICFLGNRRNDKTRSRARTFFPSGWCRSLSENNSGLHRRFATSCRLHSKRCKREKKVKCPPHLTCSLFVYSIFLQF